jgi:hypothetical protein
MTRITLALLLAAVVLGGCASTNQLSSNVSSYSRWPAERKPASYTFERLPSQEARPQVQERLENAARGAIEAAGFSAATDPAAADYAIQLGARVDAQAYYLNDDPFWWRGGFYGPYGYGPYGRGFWGPGFWGGPGSYGSAMWSAPMPIYQREVAVLIRDRRSGTPLYEARANNDGGSSAIESLLPAMFEAALKDFPNGGVNPRRVTTQITKQ